MTEYAQLRAAEKTLMDLRDTLCRKMDDKEGDPRTLGDLHRRVARALRALSGEG